MDLNTNQINKKQKSNPDDNFSTSDSSSNLIVDFVSQNINNDAGQEQDDNKEKQGDETEEEQDGGDETEEEQDGGDETEEEQDEGDEKEGNEGDEEKQDDKTEEGDKGQYDEKEGDEGQYDEKEGDEEEQDDEIEEGGEEDGSEDELYEPKYENENLLDSIAIARETYFFTYMDENEQDEINTVNERDVLKFIYEQVANTYTDVSLLEILGHIRHYYNLTYPEHQRLVALFYLSVYPQALMTDRATAGIIQTNSQGNEITNSFVQISNTNFNPSNPFASLFANLINPPNLNNHFNQSNRSNHFNPLNLINPDISYNVITDPDDEPTQSNRQRMTSPLALGRYPEGIDLPFTMNQNTTNSLHGSSLLSEIMFLSTVFNMRSNDSLTHILNLVNNIMEHNNEEKQTASNEDIKGLESEVYEKVGLDFKEKNSEYCTICQENYSKDSNLRILPCGHFFHCECIEPWLLNCSNLCPICRKKI